MRLFACWLLTLCLAAAASPAPAPLAPQNAQKKPGPPPPPPAGQERPPIFRSAVIEVVAPVTVTNSGGELVLNLKPSDFRLLDNDAPQEITVELAELPLSLVILLGNSAQMEPLIPHIRKMGNVVTNLVLGEQGEAALITFDHRVEVAQGFTRDHEKLEKIFKDLPVGSGQARLSDALVRALTMLRDRPVGRRKVILAIAEGRDWGSDTDLGFVLREAQIGGILIYSVGLSAARASLARKPANPGPSPFPPGATGSRPGIPPGAPGSTNQSGDLLEPLKHVVRGVKGILFDNPLEAYAEGTGAVHLRGSSNRAMEEALSRIGRELRSQYLLSYKPNNLNQPGFHNIKVTVDRSGAKARTRPGYYYPGGGAAENPVEASSK